VANSHTRFSRFAYIDSVAVGGLTVREEVVDEKNTAYIMTCGVLTAYRKYKIGTQLMENLIKTVKEDPSMKSIRLHVWVTNT
jgi:ribosomal protein S18 acetylase RimI-like enzyme